MAALILQFPLRRSCTIERLGFVLASAITTGLRQSPSVKPWKPKPSNFFTIASLLLLAFLTGCGGGGEESASTASAQNSGAMLGTLDAATADVLALNEAAKASALESRQATRSDRSAEAISASDATTLTSVITYCKVMGFSITPGVAWGCGITGSGPGDVYVGTISGDSIGQRADTPLCPTITVGTSLFGVAPRPAPAGTTMPADTYTCYSFVLSNTATVPVQVNLPPGTTGLLELYVVAANGAGFKMAESQSPAAPLSVTHTNANARIMMLIRTDNGNAGDQIGVGIGVPAPVPSNNSTLAGATVVTMGKTIAGKIATPGVSEAYYFYPQQAGQTTQEMAVNYTANQAVTYRSAQRTATGGYILNTEYPLPTASGVNGTLTTTTPANAYGTTTPWGIMMKVRGKNTSAPANEGFSMRVATKVNSFSALDYSNYETISLWYPGQEGKLQVATYVQMSGTVKDSNNIPVPGELVQFVFKPDLNNSATWKTVTQLTDSGGNISYKFNLSTCTGAVYSATNYGPPGSPRDHYNGTEQNGTVSTSLPNSSNTSVITLQFARICSETYLGYY